MYTPGQRAGCLDFTRTLITNRQVQRCTRSASRAKREESDKYSMSPTE